MCVWWNIRAYISLASTKAYGFTAAAYGINKKNKAAEDPHSQSITSFFYRGVTMLVGRVLSVNGVNGKAEFIPQVHVGDYIYYLVSEAEKVVCQITGLSSTPLKGLHGMFTILDTGAELPKTWENLYLFQQPVKGHVTIGTTERNAAVSFRLNPFFRHILIGGKTWKGKTHLQIVMEEEFLKLNVPSLVIDVQGEFIHLNMFNDNAIIVEDIGFEDLLSHFKFKRTVVLNLQGLSYKSKRRRCYELLSELYTAKEKDYKHAESDIRLLQIPPVIVNIDEAEVFAPERSVRDSDKDCRECLINLAKRGGKLGIGLIVNSQRLPALHYDVRSQCNSAAIFQITDSGSRMVLSQLPYISTFDLRRVRNLQRGQCIITGELTDHPMLVYVRDIKTPRAKNMDFEGMLGLKPIKEPLPIEQKGQEDIFVAMSPGITYEELQAKFPIRKVPIHGECVIIPDRAFKQGWDATLEIQGCKVIFCPDMPGGSVYLVRRDPTRVLEKIREDTPCAKCGMPKSKCACK